MMRDQPFKYGKQIERDFAEALLSYNKDVTYVRDSDKDEDIDSHFDKVFKNTTNNKIFSVDVKSPSQYGDDYFWVEDMAVFARNQHGKPRLGSIHGKADWMAWKMSDHFLMVRRTYLLRLMQTKVDKSAPLMEFSAKKDPNLYLYKYRGRVDYKTKQERGDRCSLFCVHDLDEKHFRKIPILEKEETENFINELF